MSSLEGQLRKRLEAALLKLDKQMSIDRLEDAVHTSQVLYNLTLSLQELRDSSGEEWKP